MKKLLLAAAVAVMGWAPIASAAPATAKTASGTIESYDAAAHALVLKKSSATTTYTLDDKTKVWVGAKSMAADDLAKESGARASVHYTTNGTTRTASTVRVTPASTKPAPAVKK